MSISLYVCVSPLLPLLPLTAHTNYYHHVQQVLGKKASKNHSSQGGGLAVSAGSAAPVATQAAHSGYASTVQSQPHASGGGGGGGSYRDGRATTGEEQEGGTPVSGSNAHTHSRTHSPQRAHREENAVVYNTEQALQAELALAHTNTAAADQAAEECAAREHSLMELLERERKEWHVERVKLVQCIHLQQLELASRASAAQETAGACVSVHLSMYASACLCMPHSH